MSSFLGLLEPSVLLEETFEMLPVFLIAGSGILIMIVDLFLENRPAKKILGWLSAASTLFVLFYVLYGSAGLTPSPRELFSNSFRVDAFTTISNILILTGLFLSILLSIDYVEKHQLLPGEYFSLLLFAGSGMMLMVGANNLLIFFLGFETMSISSYLLVGWKKMTPSSGEGSLKYLIAGVFSTAFLWFGLVLIYGSTETIQIRTLFESLQQGAKPLTHAGLGLILGAFMFKIAAVPFHMWAPDAYRGSPTPVMGFVSTTVKIAAFLGFARIILPFVPEVADTFRQILPVLAAVTIIVGNLAAVSRNNVKSILAYSSIAHAGYLLIGLTAWLSMESATEAGSSVLFYLLAYLFMNLGAFACMLYATYEGDEDYSLTSVRGLIYTKPYIACAFMIFLVSLTGLPPTAGFFGKVFLFKSAIQSGFLWLAIIGVLGSLLSIYYYMKIVVSMCAKPSESQSPTPSFSPSLTIATMISLWAVLFYGFLPTQFLDFARQTVTIFVHG